MTLYMKVSNDEYELPEAVAGSANELARMLGVTENAIYCGICRGKSGSKSSFVRVIIDDEEEEQ